MPTKKIFLIVLSFIIISFFVKKYALLKNEKILEGDESIVTIMAKHILEKKSAPVFVYGQDYMGSLEAYSVALSFYFFGNNVISAKYAPLFYSLFLIIFTYFLSKKYSLSKATGLFISSFIAIPPYLIIKWSLSPTGGHIENFVLIIILFLLIYNYFINEKKSTLIMASFISGFAFWTNSFSTFFILSFAIILFFKTKTKRLNIFTLFFIFFILGGLPLFIYNIKNDFITFKKLAGFFLGISKSTYNTSFTSETEKITFLIKTILSKFQIMLISFPTGGYNLIKLFICQIGSYYFDAFIYLFTIFYFVKKKIYSKDYFDKFMLLNILLVTLIMCISKRSSRPRYLLIYYPIIIVTLSYFLTKIWKTSKTAVIIFTILTLSFNLYSIKKHNKSDEIINFYRYKTKLISFLKSQKIKFLYADMYIAYPLSYLSNEQIICSPYAGWHNEDRIPNYTNLVKNSKSNVFIFFKDSYSSKTLISRLSKYNIKCKKKYIGNYSIFYNFSKYIDIDILDLPKRFRKR